MMTNEEIGIVENIYGVEVKSVTSGDLMRQIEKSCWEYEKKHHARPKYLKIPKHLFLAFQAAHTRLEIDDSGDYFEYWFGLKVCPTISIQTIEEIEVF